MPFVIRPSPLPAMLPPSHDRSSSPAPSYDGPRLTGPDEVILTLYSAVLALSELPDSIRIHVKADAGCRLKEKI
ncbi:MAG: hypothetical protein ACE10C_07040, partial [Candidatus Binatia bacterium]